jgi:hypothetical protein
MYGLAMASELVKRANWGDLSGMNFAGLVRLSFEPHRGVIRPVFEGALDDLKRGIAPNGERLDGLVVYDIDRLTQDNRHLEDAIEVVEEQQAPSGTGRGQSTT